MTAETAVDAVMSVAIGLGLASACGFRVFVPLLAVSLAGRSGYLPLSPELEWLATTPAIIAFATATVLEVVAYQVPWLDHVLDSLATPAALAGGIIASASVMTELPPLLRWSVALVGGGGAAGIIQGATVLARLKSAALTGGLGNPIVAMLEFLGAIITSFIAIFVPMLCLLLLALGCVVLFMTSRRFFFGRPARPSAAVPPLP